MTDEDAVTFCARFIIADLHLRRSVTFSDLITLCEMRGGSPLIDWTMTAREGGKCIEGEIILSGSCTLAEYRSIIPHELVHRLADTPRWEILNYYLPRRSRNRAAFLEAVAGRVGELCQ